VERLGGSKDSLRIGVTVIGTVQMVEREEREVWLNFWPEFCQTLTTAVLDIDIHTMIGLARDNYSTDMEGRICMSIQCSNLWRGTSSNSDDMFAHKTGARTGDLMEDTD